MVFSVLLALSFTGSFDVLPVPLAEPPFEAQFAPAWCGTYDIPDLLLVESTPNGGSDYEDWFDRFEDWPSVTFHGGGNNDAIRGERLPNGVPGFLRVPGNDEFDIYQFIYGDEADLAMYGDPPNRYGVVLCPRLLALYLDPVDPEPSAVLDFLTYAHGPADLEEDMPFTFQQLRWADVEDGTLYVSNAHRTYAESSGGLNGFVTAIDPVTLEVLWRSEPLVSNSENFVVLRDGIITGYGFTGEDDYLYILDRHTGNTVERIPVPSAPEYIFVEDDRLYVRCYDTDLEFSIR
ncbi:MAG: hypothetical protein QUS11_02790 [Candidatus Fermentibacter sp.]|nr:hypothetical protein [Candidatus Fermentibacter sp.]